MQGEKKKICTRQRAGGLVFPRRNATSAFLDVHLEILQGSKIMRETACYPFASGGLCLGGNLALAVGRKVSWCFAKSTQSHPCTSTPSSMNPPFIPSIKDERIPGRPLSVLPLCCLCVFNCETASELPMEDSEPPPGAHREPGLFADATPVRQNQCMHLTKPSRKARAPLSSVGLGGCVPGAGRFSKQEKQGCSCCFAEGPVGCSADLPCESLGDALVI